MPHNISWYFSLHCHISTICHTITVAISLSTATYLQNATQYNLLFLSAHPHINNMPYDICCYFSLHSQTSKICHTITVAFSLCTTTHLQYAVWYLSLFLSPLPHIYNMPHNICCHFSLHSYTFKYALWYLLLFLSPIPHIYNMPHNIVCYFCLHSHTSTKCRKISVAISLSTDTHL